MKAPSPTHLEFPKALEPHIKGMAERDETRNCHASALLFYANNDDVLNTNCMLSSRQTAFREIICQRDESKQKPLSAFQVSRSVNPSKAGIKH